MNTTINTTTTIIGKIILVILAVLLLNYLFKNGHIQKIINAIAKAIAWLSGLVILSLVWILSKQADKKVTKGEKVVN